MVGKVLTGIKRFILWDYPRASWQYDVMVALILLFIFSPRSWFNDQPRIPRPKQIAALPGATHGMNVYWIESELLANIPEERRTAKATELLKNQTGEKQTLLRLEPVVDSEQEIKGYMVFTRH